MTGSKFLIVLFIAVVALCYVAGGSAQQVPQGQSGTAIDTTGDLYLTARQDDLDSFWTDTQNWYFYGYRPYTKVHLSRFTPGMPTWNSSAATTTGGYSFGINEPWGQTSAPWQGGSPQKFQLSKNGTWH
jgi:hypothetical protein